MRLGGPVFGDTETPQRWVDLHEEKGYRAAFWPLEPNAGEQKERDFCAAAKKANIIIAECGAWSNPLSKDKQTRAEAINRCTEMLATADRIGARCCVNIAGSRGEKWDGPCSEDLLPATFDLIVQTVRKIIDAAKPTRTFYTLETMPWMYPDSIESYESLIKAIDRPGFAVHFDPVNLINCPSRFFDTGGLIRKFIEKLGPHIRSCHAKDIAMSNDFTTQLTETIPGRGGLDYGEYLRGLAKLDADTPLMMEHMKENEYDEAAQYISKTAINEGVQI